MAVQKAAVMQVSPRVKAAAMASWKRRNSVGNGPQSPKKDSENLMPFQNPFGKGNNGGAGAVGGFVFAPNTTTITNQTPMMMMSSITTSNMNGF